MRRPTAGMPLALEDGMRDTFSRIVAVWCLVCLAGCATPREVRLHNASTVDFTDVSFAGSPFGDLAAGATSGYRTIGLRLGYGVLRLKAGGRSVNGQTLNFEGHRSTYRIEIIDLDAGHLAIEIVGD